MNYDVVVVGAGPAGAISAKYAAQKRGKNPPDRGHASIGSPVQCTGLISVRALKECELGEGNFILSRIKVLSCMLPMVKKPASGEKI